MTVSEVPALPLQDLYDKAAALAGRPVEVDRVANGELVVVWINFGRSPPPTSPTEEGALTGFIAHMEKLAQAESGLVPSEFENQDG